MIKFIHLSDIHIGKKLYGYDLLEDQAFILSSVLEIVKDRRPDVVLLSGDVYDRTTPSEDAIALLNSFIADLHSLCSEIFVISGNHDPVEKLSYLSSVVDKMGVHIVTKATEYLEKRSVNNADIYCLPYIRSVDVKRIFPESDLSTVEDAIKEMIRNTSLDENKINILLSHQAVLGSSFSGSEDIVIGGDSPIDASVFNSFDYVALGHIHRAQSVGLSSVRYSGSPLKYSISEKEDKVVLYGEINDEKSLSIEEIKLKPLYDVVVKQGSFNEIMKDEDSENYVYVKLTDDNDIPDAVSFLRSKFPRFLSMEYVRGREEAELDLNISNDGEDIKPLSCFTELFEMTTKKKMSKEQEEIVEGLVNEIWGAV